MRARSRLIVVVLCALALAFAVPSFAQAASIKLSFDELVRQSDAIVVAKVVGAASRSEGHAQVPGHPEIVTDTRLQVQRVLKGSRPSTLQVTQPGGVVDGLGLYVTEVATFEKGESCLLFLDADGGLVGAGQGKYGIKGNEVFGLDMTLQEVADAVRTRPNIAEPVFPEQQESPQLQSFLRFEAIAAATDAGEEPAVVAPAALTTLFSTTFEGPSFTGWTRYSGTTWNTTSYRAAAGTYSFFGAGGGSPYVTPPTPVPLTVNSWARFTNPLDLTAYNTGTLEFDVYTNMTMDVNNYLGVMLSNNTVMDSANLWLQNEMIFDGTSGGWQHVSLDLTTVSDIWGKGTHDFTGDSVVYAWLYFRHGVGTSDEGVYVDNVTLKVDNIVKPEIASVTPAGRNAGIGETVTIAGSNFGATKGSGSVQFYTGRAGYGEGDWATAATTSWSDTGIVAVVPAGAGSGGVVVNTNAGQQSSAYLYEVGFSFSGRRWDSGPLMYKINENCVDVTGEGAAIQRAMATWSAASDFQYVYGGSTTQGTNPPGLDYSNEIYFASSGFSSPSTLAWNYIYYMPTTLVILDSNVIFNDTHTWSSTTPAAGQYDIESVALHELGHSLQLDDQYGTLDSAKVMYGYGNPGATKRVLTACDVAGAVYLYGDTPPAPPTEPEVASSTHPDQDLWYQSRSATLSFSASAEAGVAGYSYTLDATPTTTPDTVSDTTGSSTSYLGLGDGTWWFHVRAIDTEAQPGPASHFRLQVDDTNPVTGDNGEGVYLLSASITLDPYDATSGIASTYWRLDGAPDWNTGTDVLTSEVGDHTLEYYSVDAAGNAESIQEHAFTVEGVLRSEQNAPEIAYTGQWSTYTGVGSSVSGAYSDDASATITVAFEGPRFDWVTLMGPYYGIASVSVDGGPAEDVDLYASAFKGQQTAFTTTSLDAGAHVVEIRRTGRKNAAALGARLSADVFVTEGWLVAAPVPARYEQTDPTIAYTGQWTTYTGTGSSVNGAYSEDSSSSVTVAFDGTRLDWLALTGPYYGIASVSIDGGPASDVDLYAPGFYGQTKVWSTGVLSPGRHVVEIKHTGSTNPAALGNRMSVDVFAVFGSLAPALTKYEQTETAIAYSGSWTTYSGAGSSVSGAYTEDAAGAMIVAFTGDRFDWVTLTGPLYGIASVSLDGATPIDIDLYSSSFKGQVGVWSTGRITNGPHVVEIRRTGRKRTAAIGTRMSADVFAINGTMNPAPIINRYEQTDPKLTYTGGWTTYTGASSSVSGSFSDEPGASVTAVFSGTRLDWVTLTGPYYGIASVSVDGGPWADVDLYSAALSGQQKVWSTGTLASGMHSVEIRRSGRKNPAASASRLSADVFAVQGTLSQAPTLTFVQQTDPSVSLTGGWATYTGSGSSVSAAYSTTETATVECTFTGTRVDWITLTGPMYGIADVWVDAAYVGQVDLYSASFLGQQKVWHSALLAPGVHTLFIVPSGTKNPAASAMRLSIDVFGVLPGS